MGQQVLYSEGQLVDPYGNEVDLNDQTGVRVTEVFVPGMGFGPPTNGAWSPAVPRTHQKLIAGGAAGNHTVAGVAATGTALHRIISVMHYTAGALTADLTSEFSVTATVDTINNTGGTDTTDDQLMVTWQDMGDYDFGGITLSPDEDTKIARFAAVPADWDAVEMWVILLASDVASSGTVRLCSGDTTNFHSITVPVVATVKFEPPTPPTWTLGTGVMANYQTTTLVFIRDVSEDTLAVGATLMAVLLKEA